jgi:hypothetical protein
MRPRAIAGAIVVLLAGAPATSEAAYAPKLSVTFQPATAGAPAGVTTTLTQAQGETANKTIRVHYPGDFGFNPGFAVSGCPPDAEKSNSCPADSQIGNATAETVLGASSGPVFLTTDFRILVYLRTLDGLVSEKFVGYFRLSPDGGSDTVLDDLPNFPSTSSSVTLDPGPKSLLLMPRTCGSYAIVGHFTSQRGEEATSTSSVQIGGCDSAPRISRVWRAANRLYWNLTDAGSKTAIALQRLRTSHGIQWRRSLWSRTGSASRGVNSMPLARLAPGDYRFALKVSSAGGAPTDVSSLAFTVRRGRRARAR